MENNQELELAWEFVEHTGKSMFLTGKAGTGKTTFLRKVMQESTKRMIIVAPTGVAAINAGGVTIHSFFQLPLSPYVPDSKIKSKFDFGKEKRKILRTIDMLIIDEISMVRSDLLDAIDSVLRRYRNRGKPFGGVQLLMIGDLQQLTPVVTNEEIPVLQRYYDTPYFFGSHALQLVDYVTLELKHVYRQQDEKFIQILNHIRDGHPTAEDIQLLNSRYDSSFRPNPEDGYIRLTTHNRSADSYNEQELNRLKGASFHFDAYIEGTFPEYAYPTSVSLELREGAQVMFVKNDSSGEHRYYNGKIGHVVGLSDHCVQVLCPGDSEIIDVEPQKWENAKYVLNPTTKDIETEVQGAFTQLPLRLAWAITIHKSQGLTFERAIIDAGASFASGQVYVALSRCKTLEGMVLASPISQRTIINDMRVASYIAGQEEAAEYSIAHLPDLEEEYYRAQLIELFNFKSLADYEERLSRLLTEHLSRQYPQIVTHHKNVVEDMRKQVSEVSLKWVLVMNRMRIDELHAEEFLNRLTNGAGYFLENLNSFFEALLGKTKDIEIKNKEVQKRVSEALADVRLTYLSHRYLLEAMVEQGFSVQNYLKAKQEAWIVAMDEMNSGTARKRKKKEHIVKAPKIDTKDTTLTMYRQGMRPDQIAKERGLQKQTIYTHLAHFVTSGDLQIEDFVDEKKRKSIAAAIDKVGDVNGLSAIREHCSKDITYEDIKLVLASLKHSS